MSYRLITNFCLLPFALILMLSPACSGQTAGKQRKLEIQQATIDRIRIDFNTSRKEVISYLKPYYPKLTDAMMLQWEQSGALEMRIIDGQKRYFSQAARNLFRIDPEARAVWRTFYPPKLSASSRFNMAHARAVIDRTNNAAPVLEQVFTIHFTISVKPDVVPDGEMIRCWMPFPKVSLPRQPEVELLDVNDLSYTLAAPETLQRSLYIEKQAVRGQPTVFSYRARYHSSAQWFDPRKLHPGPYDTSTDLFHTYTDERPPQVIFSPLVRETADRIVGDETDPFIIVKKLYYWINENIPWASALEYSIMDCIPDYVLTFRHGDCGMQTFLFLSMCRYKGIPARWQSGWHVHPGNINLHDWSEVYFQEVGWVPVDVSFGLQDSDDPLVRDFYLTGIDAYRLIINDDFSIPFTPDKKYYRSEPYDFQRGEVEWRGENLYFNQWSYQMEVTYEK